MPNINQFSPHSGQYIKDDGSVVNLGDKIEAIYNALVVDKDAGIDVIDRAARILGKISADDAAITALGALAATAVTDLTASASVIALLKGLLKQLQGTGAGSQPIQLTGRLVQAPRLIATIPYSSLVASGSIYPAFLGVLTRGVIARMFCVTSDFDQPVSDFKLIVADSAVALSYLNGDWCDFGSLSAAPADDTIKYFFSSLVSSHSMLANPGDSIGLGISMGATLPTKGSLEIYVTEVV